MVHNFVCWSEFLPGCCFSFSTFYKFMNWNLEYQLYTSLGFIRFYVSCVQKTSGSNQSLLFCISSPFGRSWVAKVNVYAVWAQLRFFYCYIWENEDKVRRNLAKYSAFIWPICKRMELACGYGQMKGLSKGKDIRRYTL